MIPIPASAANDVQQAFRKIDDYLVSLLGARNVDLNGRRIINAGTSVDDTDYVTRSELSSGAGTPGSPIGGVSGVVAGSGISVATGLSGTVTVTNAGVRSITGTANQVIRDVATGAVTLSLPQSIATSSVVQLGGIGIGVASPAGPIDIGGGDGKRLMFSEGITDYAEMGYGYNAGNKASVWLGINLNSTSLTRTQSDTANPSWYLLLDGNADVVSVKRIAAGAGSTATVPLGLGTAGVSTYNNIATVAGGVPALYATINTTGLTANVGATTLYSVPSGGAGLYRVSALVVETTAGSVSSTLPNVQIVYTDQETSGTITLDATPVLGAAGLGQTGLLTANTAGLTSTGTVPINVKASTTIQYQTVNYASTAAGMTYALHIRLEYLG